ncbi:MAG: hypothetical protein ACLVA7_08850, partial [Faecalibacterium sp.]
DDSKTISREEVLGSSAVDNAPPKKHEGFGLRASFLLIRTVLCSSGRFCLPPLRQILLSAANCIRSRRLLNEYFPPSRYTGREME